jgi:hypothetical protein
MFLPVPRLRNPSPEEFGRFIEKRLPVVIEGALDEWAALSSWTLQRLRNAGGTTRVRVQSRRSSRADDFEYRDIAFDRFIESMESGCSSDYLAAFPLLDEVPGLWNDISVPRYAVGKTLSPRVFMGPPGSFSPLHYDLAHGLSAQILGQKRIIVLEFRPRDVVRHRDLRRPGWLSCPLDVEAPDAAGRDGLVPSRRWECTVAPGDLVFFPSRRHHFVRSLENTISVNFSWHTIGMRVARRLLRLFGRSVT